jgi:hypothetical protein
VDEGSRRGHRNGAPALFLQQSATCNRGQRPLERDARQAPPLACTSPPAPRVA